MVKIAYEDLGANFMSYHPLEKFDINTIVLLKMTPISESVVKVYTIQELPCKMVLGGHAGLFLKSTDLAADADVFERWRICR